MSETTDLRTPIIAALLRQLSGRAEIAMDELDPASALHLTIRPDHERACYVLTLNEP